MTHALRGPLDIPTPVFIGTTTKPLTPIGVRKLSIGIAAKGRLFYRATTSNFAKSLIASSDSGITAATGANSSLGARDCARTEPDGQRKVMVSQGCSVESSNDELMPGESAVISSDGQDSAEAESRMGKDAVDEHGRITPRGFYRHALKVLKIELIIVKERQWKTAISEIDRKDMLNWLTLVCHQYSFALIHSLVFVTRHFGWDAGITSTVAEAREIAIRKMSDSQALILDGIKNCIESDTNGMEAWELVGRLYELGLA